ncbi:MAG TPA: hypothetical protein VEC57_16010 [Candidatus Limnocylindrales bacterium]|nr:hypothetical protein [Candidatus Limnocylindrales bacterium]
MSLTLEEITRFGIREKDDLLHAWSQEYEWWNESYFFDWFDRDGSNAGHCRIGLHPAQKRLWFWLYLYNGEEWVVVEETRLPLDRWNGDALSYQDPWGLSFSYTIEQPLRSGHLRCAGFGRVVSGRRAGQMMEVAVDLAVTTTGAAHSVGESKVAGHSAEGLSANRFEQPIAVSGTYRIGHDERRLDGIGERDHSWGPRWWSMEWRFLILSGADFRLQAVQVTIPDVTEMQVGYLARERTRNVDTVVYDFVFDDDHPTRAVSGSFAVTAEDGEEMKGTIEPISGAEIDISHCFVPPRRSIYRRALVRAQIEGVSEPAIGWLESNRFPAA